MVSDGRMRRTESLNIAMQPIAVNQSSCQNECAKHGHGGNPKQDNMRFGRGMYHI